MRLQATLIAAMAIGVAIGLGSYTFVYAKGYSYLTNDPAACANCHVMQDHFDAWTRASHRAVATCNDCHTPPGVIGKYSTKALNGFWHSFYFTVGGYPDPLRITPRNREVTELACRTCHEELTASIEPVRSSPDAPHADGLSCISCHRTVGHLE
jgi:cytochrome c nitrite reductase small subunit